MPRMSMSSRSSRAIRRSTFRLEALEDRTAPAVTAFSAGVLSIDYSDDSESASVSNDGTNITVASSSGVTGAGVSFASESVTTILVTDSGGKTGQSLTVAGTVPFALAGGFQSIGVEVATFNNAVNAGGGAGGISVTAATGIVVNSGANLTGGGGGVKLTAQGTEGNSHGIRVITATVTTTGDGNVTVIGKAAGTGVGSTVGVKIENGAVVQAGGNGTVTVEGTGGISTGGTSNNGVVVSSATANTSRITSSGGPVFVTGTGGSGPLTNQGVVLSIGGQVTAGGMGAVTVTGTGGPSNSPLGSGVRLEFGSITSAGGPVTVTGTGTGAGGHGVQVEQNGGFITAGGTGTVTVLGFVSDPTSSASHGINLAGSGRIFGGGAVLLTATGTTTTSAVSLASGASLGAGGNADLTIVADSLTIVNESKNPSSIKAGTGSLTLKPYSENATVIDLGGEDVFTGFPLTLGLNAFEQSRISAGTLRIGDATTFAVTFSAPFTRAAATDLMLSGQAIISTVSGTDIDLTGGTLSFESGSVLSALVDGTTADTDYDRLNVAGKVNLANLGVALAGSHTPNPGDVFDLVAATGGVQNSFGVPFTTLNGVPLNLVTTATLGQAKADPTETPSLVVNLATDTVNPFDNLTSLREAITHATNLSGADTITFAPALSGQTIVLTSGELILVETGEANKTTIVGPAGGITVSGNDAGRVFVVSTEVFAEFRGMTIRDGFVSADGGGIFNDGTLTLIDCTVTGNQSSNSLGGGLANTGTMTLINCTVSGNHTGGEVGGGISNFHLLALFNTTIAFNSSTDSGGGIFNIGTLTLANSIVANNTVGGSPSNLLGSATASFSLIGGDAKLGALADNGGPTMTHKLLDGSPALNAGSNALVPAGVTTDQRGLNRFVGPVDIGSFEAQAPPLPGGAITSVKIDTGTTQRSMVRSLTLTFQSAITQSQIAEVLSNLTLTRTLVNGSLNLVAGTLLGGGTQLKLTFTGTSVIGGSLADGRYELEYGGTTARTFHRLFGDLDGDADTDADDALVMASIANNTRRGLSASYNEFLDYNSNGIIGTDDRDQFNRRLGMSI